MQDIGKAKRQFFYDGIQYCVLMVDLAYKRLESALLSLSAISSSPPDSEKVLTALTDSWLIVDVIHRLRSLLQQTPNLKKKTPEMRLFFQKTESIEDLRNAIQHLNQESESYIQNKVGAWGALTWITPATNDKHSFVSHLLVPGTVRPTEHTILNPYPADIRYPICLITLAAKKPVCISDIAKRCTALKRYLISIAPEMFSETPPFLLAGLRLSDVLENADENK